MTSDVPNVQAFERHQWRSLLEKYNYDVPKLLLEGSQHERAVLNYLVPAARGSSRRVSAYEGQLCGSGRES